MSVNAITSTGLTIQSQSDIVNEILNGTSSFLGMYAIYGAAINVNANSPDGQMINIIAQAKLDVLEFLQAIYTSFDPNQAIGVSLNSRCAINGVTRNPGTFTQQLVVVTTTQALTLPGLDIFPNSPFTVSDSNGNQYNLVTTIPIGGAGNTTLNFQAALLGPVSSLANTITTITSVTVGVSAVNNTVGPTTLGLTEETDAALRLRRQNSVALPSQGYFQGLYAGLINTVGVTQALVLENITGVTDGNGTPGHTIWCIVAGGSNTAIANVIYVERPMGVGMRGAVNVNVVQVDSSIFTVYFDRPITQPLYINFNVTALGTGSVSAHYISQQLQALLSYGINQQADITTIVALVRQISANALVSGEGVSLTNSGYTSLVSPTTVQGQFIVAGAYITINGVTNP